MSRATCSLLGTPRSACLAMVPLCEGEWGGSAALSWIFPQGNIWDAEDKGRLLRGA